MLCACGCGQTTQASHIRYVTGHRNSICLKCKHPFIPKPRSDGKYCSNCRLCHCGCGKSTTRPEYDYIRGHAPRTCIECGGAFYADGKRQKCSDCRLPPCACGCGQRVTQPHFRYRAGHALRGRHKKPTLQRICKRCGREFMAINGSRPSHHCPACAAPHLCACGCGQLTTSRGADRLRGHGESKQYRQSKPEAILHTALGSDWKYVGCDTLIDGSPNPDAHHAKGKLIYPDIIHNTMPVLLMVDGCYWHECPEHGSGTRSYIRQRDRRKQRTAEAAGWHVMRIWEHEVYDDPLVIQRIARFVQQVAEVKSCRRRAA